MKSDEDDIQSRAIDKTNTEVMFVAPTRCPEYRSHLEIIQYF